MPCCICLLVNKLSIDGWIEMKIWWRKILFTLIVKCECYIALMLLIGQQEQANSIW